MKETNDMTDERPALSVAIPVYNSAEIFPVLYERLVAALEPAVDSFEIIAVVDGNADGTADVIEGIARDDARVKMLLHSRNFGHQAAVNTGLQYARGEMVVVMDDDLEDPPEIIPAFIDKLNEGYDVVYGVRQKRKVALHKRISYFFYYRFLNSISSIQMPLDAGDFCIMRRVVVDNLNTMPERNRYVRGLRSWLGFRQTGLEYERDTRYAGEPGYNMVKYLQVGMDGILSFSYRPLYFMTLIGAVIAGISFLLGIRLVLLVILGLNADVPGWASLMVAVLFLGGVQLISIGIIGQYIARIYDEVKARPQSVVSKKVGFEETD